MSVSTKIYFCLHCNAGSISKDKIEHKECQSPFYIVEADVSFKVSRTGWKRFVHWLLSLDIGYGLAFIGAVIINAIVLLHTDLSFNVRLFESFCLGLVLIRLLK